MRSHLITLEMRGQDGDGVAGIADSFAEVGEVWGSLAGIEGVIQIGAAQIEDGVTHRAIIPWVDPTTFSHFSTRGTAERFRVRGTRDPDSMRRWLEVMGEKLNAEAA